MGKYSNDGGRATGLSKGTRIKTSPQYVSRKARQLLAKYRSKNGNFRQDAMRLGSVTAEVTILGVMRAALSGLLNLTPAINRNLYQTLLGAYLETIGGMGRAGGCRHRPQGLQQQGEKGQRCCKTTNFPIPPKIGRNLADKLQGWQQKIWSE